ncbi:MAG TPA: RNA methyltransferase [Vicinamibacterales bacterium]
MLVTPAALEALSDILPDSRQWPVYVCDRSVVAEVTGFDFHRGCLALGRRAADSGDLDDVSSATRIIGLEGIGNPDNIGGLFRVAGAMHVGGVVLDRTCADPLYRKAIRTSMGAALKVPFVRQQDWLLGLHQLRERGFRLIALTPDPAALTLEQVTFTAGERIALLLGSEGSGLQPVTLSFADVRVRIPMDPTADSLNVVVAAAIALYQLREP